MKRSRSTASLALWGACLAGLTLPASAQPMPLAVTQPHTAMPFYSAEQAVAGVYAHHLPPLSKLFTAQAAALMAAADRYCQALPTLPSGDRPRQAA